LQARIRKDGDVTVVTLMGRLDFETAEPFRETCQDMLINNKVVFNLESLNFVGSSGIGAFVTTLREFAQSNPVKPRFCHVRTEFQKIFRTSMQDSYELYASETDALKSFFDSTIKPLNLSFVEDADDEESAVVATSSEAAATVPEIIKTAT
jgi:anti-anti-sigma factor